MNNSKKNTISLCMIVKNESNNIFDCLESLTFDCLESLTTDDPAVPIFDELIVIDTGSTDNTEGLTKNWCRRHGFNINNPSAKGRHLWYETYTEASTEIDGDWQIDDFSKARNRGLELAKGRWILWVDADDRFTGAEHILKLAASGNSIGSFSFPIISDLIRFRTTRMFLNHPDVRFYGACHEIINTTPLNRTALFVDEVHIKHIVTEGKQRGKRNYRILEKEFEEVVVRNKAGYPQHRQARVSFYWARELMYFGEYERAIKIFDIYFELKPWHEEHVAGKLYKARCAFRLKKYAKAKQYAFDGLSRDDRWAEFYMLLSYITYKEGRFEDSIHWAKLAQRSFPPSKLFIEENMYQDQPLRQMSHAYARLGKYQEAHDKAVEVYKYVKVPDKSWAEHIAALKAKLNPKETTTPEHYMCPVCVSTESYKPRPDLEPHPYLQCAKCGLYYQPNMGPKVYEAFHEEPGDQMSDKDKDANMHLATFLWNRYLSKVPCSDLHHLDIGAKYPYLGHCLQRSIDGKTVQSTAIDGIKDVHKFGKDLGVKTVCADFEKDNLWILFGDSPKEFHLITLVHCIEHFYKPIETLKKIQDILHPDGYLFLRFPDHGAKGIERDFTKGHYDIHPVIWNEKSLRTALERSGNWEVVWTASHYGQRDMIVKRVSVLTAIAQNEDMRIFAKLCDRTEREQIACRRPGALGDVLMTTAAVRGLRKKYPEANIVYYTHETSAPMLIRNPDLDAVHTHEFPKIISNDLRIIDFAYPMSEGYPDKPLNRHLCHIFCEQAGVEPTTDMVLKFEEGYEPVRDTGVVTIHVKTGWSPYKDWPLDRWTALVNYLKQKGLYVIQLGGAQEPPLENVDQFLANSTTDIWEHFKALDSSGLFIGGDSVFHHAAHALQVPAVTLWGSTHPVGSGYEQDQNLTHPTLTCQPCYREYNDRSVHPKPPCPNNHACMDFLTVGRVLYAVEKQLENKPTNPSK